jgi:hypothetical protein
VINPDSIRALEQEAMQDAVDIASRPVRRPWQPFQPPATRYTQLPTPVTMTDVTGFVSADGLVNRADPPLAYPWLAKTPPRPWQEAASAWRRGHAPDKNLHPVATLEMGLGTGKTLIVIEEILKLKKAQGGRVRAIALVPNSVMDTTWATELPKHSDLTYIILSGPMKRRRAILRDMAAGRAHYDLVIHNSESYPLMAPGADGINSIYWDLVDIDEVQDFRNPTSERAKALLGRGLRYRECGGLRGKTKLMNSATLVIKKATNVYAPYKWLANCWGSLGQFRSQFVVMGGFGGHEELGIKPDKINDLKMILDRYRFTCPASVIGLPEPVFHYRRIDLPEWQRAIYRKVQDELKTEVDGQEAFIVNTLTEMLRLAQVTAGIEAIDKDVWKWHDENVKATYLFDTLLPEVFEEEDRAIVWCWFRPEVSELARMARARGYRPVMFWGGDNAAKVAAQNAFKSGEANLFIGQMKAGGRGLNLGESRTMIYLTRSFDTEAYIQSLGRDMRVDSVAGVRNRIIVEARDTVDQHISGVLRGDIKLAELLTMVRSGEILGK